MQKEWGEVLVDIYGCEIEARNLQMLDGPIVGKPYEKEMAINCITHFTISFEAAQTGIFADGAAKIVSNISITQ